jgi:protein phosphatase
MCVADGLGGHIGGEIASKLAVSIIRDVVKEAPPPSPPNPAEETNDEGWLALLTRYTQLANQSVYQTNLDLVKGGKPMGTTLLSAFVSPKKVHIVNVGDSRAYHIREGEIIGRTEDHSWVDEQVRLGLMSKAEAEVDMRKNVVTRSIGTHPDVGVDTYVWHIVPGDWIMLCTDGLVNMVKDKELVEEFRSGGTAAEITARLVRLANDNGGKDNITVITANISPNIAKLLALRTRSLVRHQGLKMLWLLVTLGAGLIGFIAGYFYRDAMGAGTLFGL